MVVLPGQNICADAVCCVLCEIVNQRESAFAFGWQCWDQHFPISGKMLWGACHLCVFFSFRYRIVLQFCQSHGGSNGTLSGPGRHFPFGIRQLCCRRMTAPFTLRASDCQNSVLKKVLDWINKCVFVSCVLALDINVVWSWVRLRWGPDLSIWSGLVSRKWMYVHIIWCDTGCGYMITKLAFLTYCKFNSI